MGAGLLLMNTSVATVDVIIYDNSAEKSLNLYLNNTYFFGFRKFCVLPLKNSFDGFYISCIYSHAR